MRKILALITLSLLAAELRRLAALSESNAIDALNYESRIERLQAENDALLSRQ
jgi:hypothetical protein